jgi:hypothetical protein
MAAAENRDAWGDGWRRRQERMRFEVLLMLYRASAAQPAREVSAWGFAQNLGIWEEEVGYAIEWLQRAGFLQYHRPGPVLSITLAGVRYIEHDAKRRKTIRGIAPPEEGKG